MAVDFTCWKELQRGEVSERRLCSFVLALRHELLLLFSQVFILTFEPAKFVLERKEGGRDGGKAEWVARAAD